MKELTFREVIANIKEGEVWECSNKSSNCNAPTISMVDGDIYIEHKARTYEYRHASRMMYKLQRKKYSFAEAFKAYEEGKEIESCFSSDCYKLAFDNLYVYAEEIKGEWHIND